jgi:hypothetical protein
METVYASRYFSHRKGQKSFNALRYPKMNLVCHARTHLWAAMTVTIGPSNDSPAFRPTVRQAARNVSFDRLMGDAAYDGEINHVVARDQLGIRSTIIPTRKRNTRKWPKAKYRRQMKRRFHSRLYGQRWQVESAIARTKRHLGATLSSRGWPNQIAECRLRVLTHNVMILAFYA